MIISGTILLDKELPIVFVEDSLRALKCPEIDEVVLVDLLLSLLGLLLLRETFITLANKRRNFASSCKALPYYGKIESKKLL